MAVSYLYNSADVSLDNIYRTTVGGTVFSANLAGSATMDYFDDAAVVDDALYFGDAYTFSDLLFNVGTQLAASAITVVWEYYKSGVGWTEIEQLTDNTNAFQTAGANTVVFPYQYDWSKTSVNSVSKHWVRCRITAVTSITEGGANQTTAPYAKDGIIYFSGTTSEDMANVPDLYAYMSANHPEVEMEQLSIGDAYLLPRSVISTPDQYFEVSNTSFFMQHGDIKARFSSFNYLYNWTVTDSFVYFNGANIYNYFVLTGTITRSILNVKGNFRWHGGTLTDTNIYGRETLRSFQGGGTITRSTIPAFLSLGTLTATIDDSEFMTTVEWYGDSFTATSSRFPEPALNHQIVSSSNTINFINPQAVMPELDTGDFISRKFTSLSVSKCWFYDDSAGTYTDYTTAANNATVGDVPLSGDVGDILYISSTHAYWAFNHTRGQGLLVTIGTPNTDYEYIYEYWNGSAWAELTMSEALLTEWGSYNGYDTTKHLTQDGLMIFKGTTGTGQTAVNGYTAYWLRIRITTKGTGTPTATEFSPRADTATDFWHCYEKYTCNLDVKDIDGNLLSGVTVTITDSKGIEQFDGVTDENGAITEQTLILKDVYFDPFNENGLPTYVYMVQETMGDYTVQLSKSGYITQTHKITMDEKKDLVFTLLEGPPTATTMAAMEVAPNLYQQIK